MKLISPDEASALCEMMAGAARTPTPAAVTFKKVRRVVMKLFTLLTPICPCCCDVICRLRTRDPRSHAPHGIALDCKAAVTCRVVGKKPAPWAILGPGRSRDTAISKKMTDH